MVRRRTQILTERQDVDRRLAQILHGGTISASVSPSPSMRLVLVRACGPADFAVREHLEGAAVARSRIAHRMREALHGLDILREHLDPASSTVCTSAITPESRA